jgi:trimeric autotransporter adhesin
MATSINSVSSASALAALSPTLPANNNGANQSPKNFTVKSPVANKVGLLSTAQIQQLSTDAIKILSTAQISNLTTDQIGALTSTQISSLSAAQVNGMTGAGQLAKLDASKLKPLAFAGITADNLKALLVGGTSSKTITLDQWNVLGSSKRSVLKTTAG